MTDRAIGPRWFAETDRGESGQTDHGRLGETVIQPVSVTGVSANFSPMPRIAVPPLGSGSGGGSTALFFEAGAPLSLEACGFRGTISARSRVA